LWRNGRSNVGFGRVRNGRLGLGFVRSGFGSCRLANNRACGDLFMLCGFDRRLSFGQVAFRRNRFAETLNGFPDPRYGAAWEIWLDFIREVGAIDAREHGEWRQRSEQCPRGTRRTGMQQVRVLTAITSRYHAVAGTTVPQRSNLDCT
jgi:hypothetical protein